MEIEWMILAEGITQDAKGAFTMVGLNQNLFATDNFPAYTKRAILTRVGNLSPGTDYRARVEVVAPGGRVLAVQEGQFQVGAPRIASVPQGGVDIPNEFQLAMTEYGTHRIGCEISAVDGSSSAEASIDLFVVPTSDLVR